MSINLPGLSPTFPEWDWTKSNGNATVLQTRKAYTAIASEGLCWDFSREVWNDITRTLYTALTTAGASWDDTYATYSNTLMSSSSDQLTAARFNSVAFNIKKLGFVSWRWANIPGILGYTGRDQFKGYAEYQLNSDRVYGWYFIHLCDKLNKVIEVLKDEADFSEFVWEHSVLSYVNAPLAAAGVRDAAFNGFEFTRSPSGLVSIPLLEIFAKSIGQSNIDGSMVTVPTLEVIADAIAESMVKADGGWIITAPATADEIARTMVSAQLLDMVFIGFMRFGVPSETLTQANLTLVGTTPLITAPKIESRVFTHLFGAITQSVSAYIKSRFLQDAVLKYIIPAPLLTSGFSRSYADTKLAMIRLFPLNVDIRANTVSNTDLQKIGALSLERFQRAFSYPYTKLGVVGMSPLITNAKAETLTDAWLNSIVCANLFAAPKIESRVYGIITMDELAFAETATKVISKPRGNLMLIPLLPLTTEAIARTISGTVLGYSLPYPLITNAYGITSVHTDFELVPTLQMYTAAFGRSKTDGRLTKIGANSVIANGKAQTFTDVWGGLIPTARMESYSKITSIAPPLETDTEARAPMRPLSQIISHYIGEVEGVQMKYAEMLYKIVSRQDSELSISRTGKDDDSIEAVLHSLVYSNGEMHLNAPIAIVPAVQSSAFYHKAEAIARALVLLDHISKAESVYIASQIALGSAPMGSINHSVEHNYGDAISKPIVPMDKILKSCAKYRGTVNTGRAAYYESTVKPVSYQQSEARAILPAYTEGIVKSDSFHEGTVEKGIPRLTSADVTINDASSSVLHLGVGIGFASKHKSSTTEYVKLGLYAEGAVEFANKSATHTDCEMELQYVPHDDWIFPERRENDDLYIRQVYNSWDKGDVLYLDAELWFSPIRTSNNLYIRSEESMEVRNG